jgi:hypothetical protein
MFLLSLKLSLWKKITDLCLSEKEIYIGKIEDRELFDDEVTVMQTLSSFSEKVMQ